MAGVSGLSWPFPFCCAPLPAVRRRRNRHKVPEFPGVMAARRPTFPDRYCDESECLSVMIALGGYRPRGCQVAEKQVKWTRTRNVIQVKAAHEGLGRADCCTSTGRNRCDQALALVSTAARSA